MSLFLAGAVIITAGGLFGSLVKEKYRAYFVSAAVFAGAAASLWTAMNVLFFQGPATAVFCGIIFSMDRLSAFFTAIICVMGFFSVLYSAYYMKSYFSKGMTLKSHYIFLTILLSSMLLITVSRDAVTFMISWEIMALSSFFLVTFENEKKEVFEAGIYYLILSHISAALLLAGFAVASNGGMNLSFDSLSAALKRSPDIATAPFALLFLGFAVKAGVVPAHTWLPKAHPAAPSHVSGLMSGVMIKMGIYGMARTIMMMPAIAPAAGYTVLFFGILTALTGILYTLTQRDIKRMLAYSSIENIGIITAGLGLGMLGISYHRPLMAMLGFLGALMHVLNHSVFKELLFFGAGTIYRRVHTRDIEHMGGLAKKMPLLSICFLIGSAAIAGLPGLNGFISEFILYLSMLQAAQSGVIILAAAGIAAIAGLAFTGAMAVISFTRIYSAAFLGSSRSKNHEIEKGEGILGPVIFISLAAVCFCIGLLPQLFYYAPLMPAMDMISGAGLAAVNNTALVKPLASLSALFFILCGFVMVVLAIKSVFLRKRTAHAATWGCGYRAVTTRMQYSAYSYSEPFTRIMDPFIEKQKNEIKPAGFFPEKASYEPVFSDAFEKLLVRPVAAGVRRFLKLFVWIQSGSMQRYILYGIIFLVISLIWAVK